MLDWIIQMSAKAWATPQDKSDLLDALNSIVQPQRNLCGFGGDKRIDATEILKKRFEGIEIPPIEEEQRSDSEES